MNKYLLIITISLFSNSIFGQSTSIKDFQIFNQAESTQNIESGVTVIVYKSRYIFDDTAKEKCNDAFSNLPGELKEVQNGEYLAFVVNNKEDSHVYIFNEQITFTNVSGEFLKYLKCWADSDPTSTVEIKK